MFHLISAIRHVPIRTALGEFISLVASLFSPDRPQGQGLSQGKLGWITSDKLQCHVPKYRIAGLGGSHSYDMGKGVLWYIHTSDCAKRWAPGLSGFVSKFSWDAK